MCVTGGWHMERSFTKYICERWNDLWLCHNTFLHRSFLDTNTPLQILIEAAKSGSESEVEQYAQVFNEHARKLVEVREMSWWLLV